MTRWEWSVVDEDRDHRRDRYALSKRKNSAVEILARRKERLFRNA